MRLKVIFIAGLTLVVLGVFLQHRFQRQPVEPELQTPEPEQTQITQEAVVASPLLPQPIAPKPVALPAQSAPKTNLLARLLAGDKSLNLTLEQIEPFLQKNRRSAESLLAAARLTGDSSFLREAVEKYPSDPQVNFAAIFKSDVPEERRQRLDAFKQSAPDNALANYLSAQEYFKSGQIEQALQEIAAASAKKFQDYSGDFVQNTEEAYQAAGYAQMDAKVAAAFGLPLPHLAELRRLGYSLADLANTYRQNGNEASAHALVQSGINLAAHVGHTGGNSYMIKNLVGLAIERKILEGMDPVSPYDTTGRTVQDRLGELVQSREAFKDLGKQTERLLQKFSESDMVSYLDRVKVSGELEALRWALNRQTEK